MTTEDEFPEDEVEDDETAGPALPVSAGSAPARTLAAPMDVAASRLDAWLAGQWLDISRARIRALIEGGALTEDGASILDYRKKPKPGAVYVLTPPPMRVAAPEPEDLPLEILFEDEFLVVVNKPAGMASHPGHGCWTGTLVNALLHHCAGRLSGIGGQARPGIVHRLDKDTSGLMVAAKTEEAHMRLSRLFAQRRLERAYLAIARGAPHPREGRIETLLARSNDDRRKMAVLRTHAQTDETSRGKRAATLYRTLETFGQMEGEAAGRPAASLIECRLETGRTHQVRVHMAHIGCPLIGDPLYGKFRGLKAEGVSAGVEAAKRAARDFPRQALHAYVLGFQHPITGQDLRFERLPPPDMAELLAALRGL